MGAIIISVILFCLFGIAMSYAAKFIKEIVETQNIWLEKSKLNAA